MKTSHELVIEARRQICEIDPAEAEAVLARGAVCLLIDVREADEYAQGHLPGAINIPRGVLEFRVEMLSEDRGAPLLVYCKTSGRAALGCLALADMGYANVRSIRGGFDHWLAEGRRVIEPVVPTYD